MVFAKIEGSSDAQFLRADQDQGRAALVVSLPGFADAQFLSHSVVVNLNLEATMITHCSDGFRPIKHGEYGVDGPLAAAVAFAARLGPVLNYQIPKRLIA